MDPNKRTYGAPLVRMRKAPLWYRIAKRVRPGSTYEVNFNTFEVFHLYLFGRRIRVSHSVNHLKDTTKTRVRFGGLKALAVLLLLVVADACASVRPVVYMNVYDDATGIKEPLVELPDNVVDACDILELDCVTDAPAILYGRINVYIMTDPDGEVWGRAILNRGCTKIAWSADRPKIIAHEMGHLLGLDHVDGDYNLMNPRPKGTKLSAKQLRKVHRLARLLYLCVPHA